MDADIQVASMAGRYRVQALKLSEPGAVEKTQKKTSKNPLQPAATGSTLN